MKKFNKLWEEVHKLKLLFFYKEDLVEDIEFSLSGNKKTLNKRFTSLSPSRKVLL